VYRQDLSDDGWEFYKYQLTGRTGTTSTTGWTEYTAGTGTPASFGRPGALRSWTLPARGALRDGNEAEYANIGLNEPTALLRTEGIRPEPLIPASATVNRIRVRVRHRQSGDIGVVMDRAQLVVGGVPVVGNLIASPLTVPSISTDQEFIVSSLPVGVNLSALNAGDVGFEVGYVGDSILGTKLQPSSWTVSPVLPTTDTGNQTSRTVTILATYNGPAVIAPPYIVLDITGTVTTTLVGLGVNPFDLPGPLYSSSGTGSAQGFVTVDNGLGFVDTGPLSVPPTPPIPSSRTATGGMSVRVPVVAGVASYTFTMSSNGSVTPPSSRLVTDYSVSGAIGVPAPAQVHVDAMELSVESTVTSSYTSGLGWSRVCYTPNGIKLAVRSSGELDLIERDSRTGATIGGPNRDGGQPMPTAYWTSQDMSFEGRKAWLSAVQYHTGKPLDEVSVLSSREGTAFSAGLRFGQASSRWSRFGPTYQGIRHRVRVEASESLDSLDGLTIEFGVMSRHWMR
jgi:hypothetical protein